MIHIILPLYFSVKYKHQDVTVKHLDSTF